MIKEDSRIPVFNGETVARLDAYKRGIPDPIATLRPELIIQMDADHQTDPATLLLVVKPTQIQLHPSHRIAPHLGIAPTALSIRRRSVGCVGTSWRSSPGNGNSDILWSSRPEESKPACKDQLEFITNLGILLRYKMRRRKTA